MKIYITETHLKKILNESLTPDEQLDEFNNTEDKVKSFFMGKKKVKMWHDRLKEKYPSLLIRFQIDGDVLRAEASIKKIQEQVEEFLEENSIYDLETEGWAITDSEMWIDCEIDIEKCDD